MWKKQRNESKNPKNPQNMMEFEETLNSNAWKQLLVRGFLQEGWEDDSMCWKWVRYFMRSKCSENHLGFLCILSFGQFATMNFTVHFVKPQSLIHQRDRLQKHQTTIRIKRGSSTTFSWTSSYLHHQRFEKVETSENPIIVQMKREVLFISKTLYLSPTLGKSKNPENND